MILKEYIFGLISMHLEGERGRERGREKKINIHI